jgi:hypothetical protein
VNGPKYSEPQLQAALDRMHAKKGIFKPNLKDDVIESVLPWHKASCFVEENLYKTVFNKNTYNLNLPKDAKKIRRRMNQVIKYAHKVGRKMDDSNPLKKPYLALERVYKAKGRFGRYYNLICQESTIPAKSKNMKRIRRSVTDLMTSNERTEDYGWNVPAMEEFVSEIENKTPDPIKRVALLEKMETDFQTRKKIAVNRALLEVQSNAQQLA